VTDTTTISYNKASKHNADLRNPVKKVHCVSNKLLVVIDENIAKHLHINENDSWFEQVETEDGILLKKYCHLLPEVGGSS